ncbi:hypothetical protein FHG87_021604 [Trinorchestia longiramus]|nr:hypothetical protein FHG87_021604 [Trinorchestia longiramus]
MSGSKKFPLLVMGNSKTPREEEMTLLLVQKSLNMENMNKTSLSIESFSDSDFDSDSDLDVEFLGFVFKSPEKMEDAGSKYPLVKLHNLSPDEVESLCHECRNNSSQQPSTVKTEEGESKFEGRAVRCEGRAVR